MRRGSTTISFAPCAQPLLHARREHRVAVGRIGADHHHHVGMLDRVEILRAGRGAERGAQSVAGRRMADAGAGVGVVVAEHLARQLLHQIGLFVGAARRGDDADRILAGLAWMRLNSEATRPIASSQRDLAPGIGDLLAHHRLEDAVRVVGIAPGEAALHAGMAVVRLAVLPRHHAHHRVALHLGLEVAADAAIGAGGDDGMLGLAEFDHRSSRSATRSGRPARRRRRTRIPTGQERSRPRRRRPSRRSRGPRWSARRCSALPRMRARSASRRCSAPGRTGSTGLDASISECR